MICWKFEVLLGYVYMGLKAFDNSSSRVLDSLASSFVMVSKIIVFTDL